MLELLARDGRLVAYLAAHFARGEERRRAARAARPCSTRCSAASSAGAISRGQAIGIGVVLVGAGGESTASLVGSAVRVLAERPELAGARCAARPRASRASSRRRCASSRPFAGTTGPCGAERARRRRARARRPAAPALGDREPRRGALRAARRDRPRAPPPARPSGLRARHPLLRGRRAGSPRGARDAGRAARAHAQRGARPGAAAAHVPSLFVRRLARAAPARRNAPRARRSRHDRSDPSRLLRKQDWRVRLEPGRHGVWLLLGLLYISSVVGWGDFVRQQAPALGRVPRRRLRAARVPLVRGRLLPPAAPARAEHRRCSRQQLEVMRQSAAQSELQSRAIAADELHSRQDTFLRIAEMVSQQLGVTAGWLYTSWARRGRRRWRPRARSRSGARRAPATTAPSTAPAWG